MYRLAAVVLLFVGLLITGCDAVGPEPGADPPPSDPPPSDPADPSPPAASISVDACAAAPVRLLTAFDGTLMPEGYAGGIVSPGPYQQQAVEDAFALAPELLCQAVDYVVYMQRASDELVFGWVRNAQGNVVFLSALPGAATESNLDPDRNIAGNAVQVYHSTIRTILHEAAHSAHLLLDARSEALLKPPSVWSASVTSFADSVVAAHRLLGGVENDEWERLHATFVDEGVAQPFYGNDAVGSIPDDDLATSGFMSAYGGTKPADDIAETVAAALTGEYLTRRGIYKEVRVEDRICQTLWAQELPDLSLAHAAAFTKLTVLHDWGFLSDAAYDWCRAGVGERYNDATREPGFHLYDKQVPVVAGSIDEEVTAKMGERDGTGGLVYFQMDAAGTLRVGSDDSGYTPHRAEMSLMLDLDTYDLDGDIDDVSWPRGLYRLTVPAQAVLGGSRFIVEFPDAARSSVWATDGYVLVLRASNTHIEGAVRVTDTIRPLNIGGEPFFHRVIQFVLRQ